MLRNLEAKLGGLVEGAFGRAFRTSVQPVELAHKLAKEMEDNQMASVSRVYVPNHYRVYLSRAGPRAVRELRARAAQGAVRLPARARPPGAVRALDRPQVEFHTDERLDLGEFGIQAELVALPEEERPQDGRPGALVGRLRPHDGLLPEPRRAQARSSRSTTGARRCSWAGPPQRAEREPRRDRAKPRGGHRAAGPERLAAPRRAPPRRGGWQVVDLGSTNGIKVNGQRVDTSRCARATRSRSA